MWILLINILAVVGSFTLVCFAAVVLWLIVDEAQFKKSNKERLHQYYFDRKDDNND